MYPAIMFTVAITVMVFMLIKVVPVFAKMYEGMGVALPTPTAVILKASEFYAWNRWVNAIIKCNNIFYYI